MTDRVNYAMPLGLLGRLLHALVIKRLLARIFDYRSTTSETVFEVDANLTNTV